MSIFLLIIQPKIVYIHWKKLSKSVIHLSVDMLSIKLIILENIHFKNDN